MDDTPCRVSADLRAYQARQADMTADDIKRLNEIRRDVAIEWLATPKNMVEAFADLPDQRVIDMGAKYPGLLDDLADHIIENLAIIDGIANSRFLMEDKE